MRIYYIRFAGHLNFGAWRDEMQAQGWLNEIGQLFKKYAEFALDGNPRDADDEELTKMHNDLNDILFGCADEQTKIALRKDPGNTQSIALFSQEGFRDDPNNVKIDGFEIQDSFYGESLERRFRKHIK